MTPTKGGAARLECFQARFSEAEVRRAHEQWGFNCGPGALCGILHMTPDEIRMYLLEFEQKGYTNPTLMWNILRKLRVNYRCGIAQQSSENQGMLAWPEFGIARIQSEGPWTRPGVPLRARYRHTHWVGCAALPETEPRIFDVNCMSVGGWVPLSEWSSSVVPWLLNECVPRADGRWHITHSVEICRWHR